MLTEIRSRNVSYKLFHWFLVGTFLFNLGYSLSYFIQQGLWEASSVSLNPNAVIFQDDRDGWLRAAQYIVQEGSIGSERWQLNFWPPGQVLLTAVLVFLFRDYQLILMAHVTLCSILLLLIYRRIFRLSEENSVNRILVFCSLLFWNFSFMNRSSLSTLVLCPDYVAALLFALGLLIALDKNLQKMHPIQLFNSAILMSLAAYLRITYYQAIWIIFIYAFIRFIFRGRKNQAQNKFSRPKFLIVFLMSVIMFLPWIGVRYFENGETLFKAFQFSEQSRFSMTVAWWDEDVIKKFRLEHIGAGIACKIDPPKCKFFANRDKAILAGATSIDWGTDADEKTQAAFRAYLSDPGFVLRSKFPILWNAYFQRIAFSSIEGRAYYTWDKLLFLVLLIGSFAYLFYSRKREQTLFLISLIGVGWFFTLLLTQVEFRYLLPSFVMILIPVAQLQTHKLP